MSALIEDVSVGSLLRSLPMHRFGYIVGLILGAALIVGTPLGVFFGLRAIWHELNGANPNLAIALITGATTIVVSTITVMVGRHYERKREIEAHFRATKLEMYEDFVKEFFGLFDGSGQDKDLTPFLREWQRKLVLKAGPEVLGAYFDWKTKIKANAQSAESLFAMDKFFRALRSDVGQSSRGLEKGAFTHMILRNSEIFLRLAKKNPKATLSQLADVEKALGLAE
jgi:hypothetical protein